MATRLDHDPLLTVQQLAVREGLTKRQVWRLIYDHKLPVYRVLGVKIRLSEYLAWLAERRLPQSER